MARLFFPQEFRDRDAQVERALGLENPTYNTLTTRVIYAEDQRDFLDFVRTHPGTMLRKWWKAYHVFWRPIANYGRMFLALFATSNRITNPFDAPEIVRQLLAGRLPDTQYVMSGSSPWNPERPLPQPQRSTPTTLYTARWVEPFALMLEMAGVHLLLPLVGVVWLAHRVRHGWSAAPVFEPLRMAALLVGAVLYGYLAVLANLVETAENMRYRLEVEPVIWVITVICVTELAGLLRARWGRADLVRVPRADHPAAAALAGKDAFRVVTATSVAR
jgi:NADH:ubiquinone oxidoreductase subunit 6 (subunit J)